MLRNPFDANEQAIMERVRVEFTPAAERVSGGLPEGQSGPAGGIDPDTDEWEPYGLVNFTDIEDFRCCFGPKGDSHV